MTYPWLKKNHHLKVRCSLIIIKHCVQAEINSHAMVFCEAESLHHMRNGWVSWLHKGQNLQQFEWHSLIFGRDYWFGVSWVEIMFLKMLSTHSLTKMSLQVSEARNFSNEKCKVLFHIKIYEVKLHQNIFQKKLCVRKSSKHACISDLLHFKTK